MRSTSRATSETESAEDESDNGKRITHEYKRLMQNKKRCNHSSAKMKAHYYSQNPNESAPHCTSRHCLRRGHPKDCIQQKCIAERVISLGITFEHQRRRKQRLACMNTPLKTWAASSGMRLAGTVICLYSALARATAADNESMNWDRSLLREGIS